MLASPQLPEALLLSIHITANSMKPLACIFVLHLVFLADSRALVATNCFEAVSICQLWSNLWNGMHNPLALMPHTSCVTLGTLHLLYL